MVSVANDTLVGTGNLVAVARSTLVGVRGEELGGHLHWRGLASVSPLEQEDMRRTLPSVW